MNKKKSGSTLKNALIVLLIAIVVGGVTSIVVGGSAYWWQSQVIKKVKNDADRDLAKAKRDNSELMAELQSLKKDSTSKSNSSPTVVNTIPGWQIYKSAKDFSFQYPKGYKVNETTDPENSAVTVIHITHIEKPTEPQKMPVLQINVSETSVSFALWEGAPWSGYPGIIKTFKYTSKK